ALTLNERPGQQRGPVARVRLHPEHILLHVAGNECHALGQQVRLFDAALPAQRNHLLARIGPEDGVRFVPGPQHPPELPGALLNRQPGVRVEPPAEKPIECAVVLIVLRQPAVRVRVAGHAHVRSYPARGAVAAEEIPDHRPGEELGLVNPEVGDLRGLPALYIGGQLARAKLHHRPRGKCPLERAYQRLGAEVRVNLLALIPEPTRPRELGARAPEDDAAEPAHLVVADGLQLQRECLARERHAAEDRNVRLAGEERLLATRLRAHDAARDRGGGQGVDNAVELWTAAALSRACMISPSWRHVMDCAPAAIACARLLSAMSKCSRGVPGCCTQRRATPIVSAIARSSSGVSAIMWHMIIRPNCARMSST